jgi:hypothetical protein
MFGFKRERVEIAEPEVDAGFSREETLLDELHAIDKERDIIAAAIKDFRAKRTVLIDGVLKYQCEHISDRPSLDKVWGDLLRADSKLLAARNLILRDLAQIRVPGFQN